MEKEQEQKQRRLERTIRKTKREVQGLKAAMDGAKDPADKAELKEAYRQKALKLQEQNKKYRAYCEETGLKTQNERLRIAGWDRKQAASATAAARSAAKAAENPLTEQRNGDIIDKKGQPEEKPDVHAVGRIDRELYKGVTEDIRTDEVIITDERIAHIKERHPGAYEAFSEYLRDIVEEPDFILPGNRKNTAMILKEIVGEGKITKTVLWLATHADKPGYKNSIMTLVKIDRDDWERLLRNKKILYRRR